jgi:transcriptional regulator of heat shock response
MNQRQQNLLKIITSHYIKTAVPVSSKFITDSGKFKLSSATIRNEMAELEQEGYIYHPHTSAGRMPTELGYQFFVDNFLNDLKLGKREQTFLDTVAKAFKKFEPRAAKELAKGVAEFSRGTVFIAFSDRDFYYTGIANLFAQPEFYQHQLVYDLSRVIDHLDSVVNKIFDIVEYDVEIYIGSQNPFSRDCSSVITKYKAKKDIGLLGILGPTRMDYENNVSLLKYAQELINSLYLPHERKRFKKRIRNN